MLFLSILIATLLIQIPNLWAINNFDPSNPIKSSLMIGVLMLPASFLATSVFSYYYGKGAITMGYPMLVLLAFSMSLTCSFIVHVYILKSRDFSLSEIIGIIIMIIGALIVVFRDSIDNIIK